MCAPWGRADRSELLVRARRDHRFVTPVGPRREDLREYCPHHTCVTSTNSRDHGAYAEMHEPASSTSAPSFATVIQYRYRRPHTCMPFRRHDTMVGAEVLFTLQARTATDAWCPTRRRSRHGAQRPLRARPESLPIYNVGSRRLRAFLADVYRLAYCPCGVDAGVRTEGGPNHDCRRPLPAASRPDISIQAPHCTVLVGVREPHMSLNSTSSGPGGFDYPLAREAKIF